MERFETFISQLRETNVRLNTFTDFAKVRGSVNEVLVALNSLNALIGADDIEAMVNTLWQFNANVFQYLPLLIAVRLGENKSVLNIEDGASIPISDFLSSPNRVVSFLRETGLYEVFERADVHNLVDYVFGIEVGLDTNARKNRVGHLMENDISNLFLNAQIPFSTEVYSSAYPKVAVALGADKKRFDFVVTTRLKTYLIEVNFYSTSGSKLNEVARSYSELAPRINALEGYEFVWITDGIGWKGAKTKLQEAFALIPRIYNLTSVSSFIRDLQNEL